ncbi:MAG: hypothetical protein WC310_05900 [Patescibacteria group bacterium]
MTEDEIKRYTKIYKVEREAIENNICPYDRLVFADTIISMATSEIEREIDRIKANIGVTIKEDGGKVTEAKIERAGLAATIEERHLLRIFQALYLTIRSKEYNESK